MVSIDNDEVIRHMAHMYRGDRRLTGLSDILCVDLHECKSGMVFLVSYVR